MEIRDLRKLREIRRRVEVLPVEIRYENEEGNLETRCGYFCNFDELPEGMEVPERYKDSYPIGFPFVSIGYKLDRNHTPRETKMYRPEDILSITPLKPVPLS